jgi:hypothetical protein
MRKMKNVTEGPASEVHLPSFHGYGQTLEVVLVGA